MQYAIELFFDEKTEKEIKTLVERVAEIGIVQIIGFHIVLLHIQVKQQMINFMRPQI